MALLQSGQKLIKSGRSPIWSFTQLVPNQYLQRVSANLVAVFYDENRLIGANPFGCFMGRHKLGVIDRWDTVFRRSA